MPEAIASVIGGGMQASASKKAAKTSAQAQLEAARMQQEAAREALGLSREQFEYGQEQDLYQRALQRQQAAQQAAQLQQIQPFINLGLGSLQGLSQMVNPTMQVDPGLYALAGMEPREATIRQPSQADWNPTFDYGVAQDPVPALNFDEMDDYIQQQLEARRQAQVQVQPQQQVSSSLGLPPEGQEIIDKLIQSQALTQAIQGATNPSTLQSLMPDASPSIVHGLVRDNKRRILADANRRRLSHRDR